MLGNIGASELVVVALVMWFLFGSKKLNELARGLGKSTRELKKVKKEFDIASTDDGETETKTNEEKDE